MCKESVRTTFVNRSFLRVEIWVIWHALGGFCRYSHCTCADVAVYESPIKTTSTLLFDLPISVGYLKECPNDLWFLHCLLRMCRHSSVSTCGLKSAIKWNLTGVEIDNLTTPWMILVIRSLCESVCVSREQNCFWAYGQNADTCVWFSCHSFL